MGRIKTALGTKHLFTIITPEGREKVLGLYLTEGTATAAFAKKWPADWRALCSGPLDQGEVPEGRPVPEKYSTWAGW